MGRNGAILRSKPLAAWLAAALLVLAQILAASHSHADEPGHDDHSVECAVCLLASQNNDSDAHGRAVSISAPAAPDYDDLGDKAAFARLWRQTSARAPPRV